MLRWRCLRGVFGRISNSHSKCLAYLDWFLKNTLSQRTMTLPFKLVNAERHSSSAESTRNDIPLLLSQGVGEWHFLSAELTRNDIPLLLSQQKIILLILANSEIFFREKKIKSKISHAWVPFVFWFYTIKRIKIARLREKYRALSSFHQVQHPPPPSPT
jgi:hypothetical protein